MEQDINILNRTLNAINLDKKSTMSTLSSAKLSQNQSPGPFLYFTLNFLFIILVTVTITFLIKNIKFYLTNLSFFDLKHQYVDIFH